jgi:uncharacterized protein involved in exopolysaccharide biosynthesis
MDNFKAPKPADSKLQLLDYWRIIRIRKTVIVAVFLYVVVITTTVVTYMLPETFMSSTRIKVKETSDIPLLGQAVLSGPPILFLQTEFEVIQWRRSTG